MMNDVRRIHREGLLVKLICLRSFGDVRQGLERFTEVRSVTGTAIVQPLR
jgi:hypothetical protein